MQAPAPATATAHADADVGVGVGTGAALDKVLTAAVGVEVEVEAASRVAWHQQETLMRAQIRALEDEARDLREANTRAHREHEAREAALLEELDQLRKLQLRQGSTGAKTAPPLDIVNDEPPQEAEASSGVAAESDCEADGSSITCKLTELRRENASLLRALHATGAARARAEAEAAHLRLQLHQQQASSTNGGIVTETVTQ